MGIVHRISAGGCRNERLQGTSDNPIACFSSSLFDKECPIVDGSDVCEIDEIAKGAVVGYHNDCAVVAAPLIQSSSESMNTEMERNRLSEQIDNV